MMTSTTTTTITHPTAIRAKTMAGRRASTSPPRASRAGGPGSSRTAARAVVDDAITAAQRLRRDTTHTATTSTVPSTADLAIADEFANGAYDLPDGADEDRQDRSRRRRRDREDRGERTGILRLRRDRGEDIWPDDGISDEDYWASVAADRPLTGTDTPLDDVPGAGGAQSRSGIDASRPGVGASRPGVGTSRPGPGGADSRFGGDQRAGERGVTGRLGPPPGLAGDFKTGAPGSAGAMGSPGQPGGSGRTGSGPMPARPGTGPTPTVGVTSSRPPAGRSGMRPGPAQPGTGPGRLPQPAARPSFQPNGFQSSGGPAGGGPAGGRQQDRNDWGDRTERIERIDASGYPDARPSSRNQRHRLVRRAQGLGSARARAFRGTRPHQRGRTRPGRQRRLAGRRPPGRTDRHPTAASQTAETTAATRRTPGAASARGGAPARASTDDDPLTSKAYSRSALSETDGRSYRAAARRSEAQARLTDQAETFITGHYQQPSQYQAGRTGEYRQYGDDAQAPAAAAPAGRYPASGSQASGGQREHSAQPGRNQTGQGQGPPGTPANRASPAVPLAGRLRLQAPRPTRRAVRDTAATAVAAAGPREAPAARPDTASHRQALPSAPPDPQQRADRRRVRRERRAEPI